MEYKPTIGLEIHTELKTKTKMFCGCTNDASEQRPNINICPICLGHPGTLPTANFEAIKKVIKLGLALNGQINKVSKFDRKNYFYPDLPKAYQISQYDQPLVEKGELKGVKITRVHLEEDTARLLHSSQFQNYPKNADPATLVDYNRSGRPLMELVSEPDITDGKQAMEFAKELQRILRYLDISDADMEKGQMRVEANISISKTEEFGTKVEVKNLNSFKAVGDAIDYEIKRQAEVLDRGEKVIQETRGWDEKSKSTFSQRLKEQAHDYRYFPEPDLPPLVFTDEIIADIKAEISELPDQRRERYIKEYGINQEQADNLVENKSFADYFEKAAKELEAKSQNPNFQILYNYFTSDLKGLMKEGSTSIDGLKIPPAYFAHLINLLDEGKLNSRMAKDVLKEMHDNGADPEIIIKEKGFHEAVSSDELGQIIDSVIANNPKAIEDYKKGQQNALQFLFGQIMAKLKGRGNPQKLQEMLKEKLSQ